jgi:hypothetical protein
MFQPSKKIPISYASLNTAELVGGKLEKTISSIKYAGIKMYLEPQGLYYEYGDFKGFLNNWNNIVLEKDDGKA